MNYQVDRTYFGVSLPTEQYGRAYSNGSMFFKKARDKILIEVNPDILKTVEIMQRQLNPELANFPCYIAFLFRLWPHPTPADQKEELIRLACRYMAGEESLIGISVSSRETSLCEEWLDFAKVWPNTTVIKTHRVDGAVRDVYTILFPGRED